MSIEQLLYYVALAILALAWLYVATRMMSRAVVRTIRESRDTHPEQVKGRRNGPVTR